MSSKSLLAAFIVSTVVLTGSALAHDYEGNFTGPYVVVGSAQGKTHGEMTLEIKNDGRVVGAGKNLVTKAAFRIEGTLNDEGDFKGILEGKEIKLRLEGTLFKTKYGHLKGTLLQYIGEERSDGAITVNLEGKK